MMRPISDGVDGGFVLLTVLMVPYLRKFNKATVPDFIAIVIIRSLPVVLRCCVQFSSV